MVHGKTLALQFNVEMCPEQPATKLKSYTKLLPCVCRTCKCYMFLYMWTCKFVFIGVIHFCFNLLSLTHVKRHLNTIRNWGKVLDKLQLSGSNSKFHWKLEFCNFHIRNRFVFISQILSTTKYDKTNFYRMKKIN